MRRASGLAALSLLASAGCTIPREALPAGENAALTDIMRYRLRRPLSVQRAEMVSRIRSDVREQAPTADTPAFERVLAVIAKTPRERLVLPAGRRFAYIDTPQQIGWDQTISDPYVVTLMTAALDLPPGATVLDIGTGSGYQAAVLSPLATRVFSIEIVDPLARAAAARLRELGYGNVEVRTGDEFAGWPEHAPFDGIVVAAGAADVPAPLLAQLRPGGRLVMPIGPSATSEQILVVTKRADGTTSRCSLGWAMFVPFTGRGAAAAGGVGVLDRTTPLCFETPIT